MKTLRLFTAIGILALLVLGAGCSTQDTNDHNSLLAPSTLHLVGDWKHQDAPIKLRIKEDNTGFKQDTLQTRSFTWDTEGKDLIFTYDDSPDEPQVAKYTVGAADLNLIWPDNTTERYVRQ